MPYCSILCESSCLEAYLVAQKAAFGKWLKSGCETCAGGSSILTITVHLRICCYHCSKCGAAGGGAGGDLFK